VEYTLVRDERTVQRPVCCHTYNLILHR
jgi:hypothetical protein